MRIKNWYLTDPQVETLNSVLIAAGQVSAGSIAAPFLFPSIDRPSTEVLVFGITMTLICWVVPIITSRRLRRK